MNRRRARASILALVVASGAIADADMVEVPPDPLPTVETTLANQLRVIVAPDPTAASIVVHVRYLGGVADEPVAAMGTTHLIERLMFAGTVHVKDGDFEAKLAAVGGWASSEVTADHVSTIDEVPPEALELVLWLEAERMAGLADGVTDAGLDRERRAIFAERRAAYVDHPYGLVARTAQKLLWGDSANGHDPLADGIDHMTRAAVRDIITKRIVPRNAVLVIAGRVDPQQAAALAKKYFAWIPSPGTTLRTDRESPAPMAKRAEAVVADPVPKVMIAFRTGVTFEPDTIALEVGAHILAGGRTSRLWRALVDGGLATDVHADVVHQHRGGELRIIATARPGVDPARLGAGIRAAIADLRDHEASPAEVQRATAAMRAELVAGMENLAVRASTIADWSSEVGSTQFLVAMLAKLHVGERDVQRAAARWLSDPASATVVGK